MQPPEAFFGFHFGWVAHYHVGEVQGPREVEVEESLKVAEEGGRT